jgi:triosephosphate isomerase
MKHETYNKLIVANWKCNPVILNEAEELSRATQRGAHGLRGIEVVLCPPFPYLSAVNLQISIVKLGAQDCFYEQKGAYTGAVSPAMLRDIGCEYVIIGHSERKQYFGETNEIINKKIKAALKAGLRVILCIGEDTRDTFDSRGHWTHEIDPRLKDQLVIALAGVKKGQIQNITVAYEPVWAIGTGNAATPDDVLSAKIFVKKIISNLYSRKEADKIRVLYGGSTDKKNAASFIKDGQADGLLVGGSSLDADEFVAMAKSII